MALGSPLLSGRRFAQRSRRRLVGVAAGALCLAPLAWRGCTRVASVTIPSLTLSGGGRMQQLALGLYNVPREQVDSAVRSALDAGIRNFDFAAFYGNEAESGAAVRQWLGEGHDRSELFVTTKVWTTDLGDPAAALRSAKISIDELGLGPVDCVMVHWPRPGKHVAAYVALEALVREGLTKSLGISNYSPADFEDLMKTATIKPEVNTFENNPMLYRKEWVDYFQSKGLVVQAYKPLQRGGAVLTCDAVQGIAARLGKSPAQVCLRWNVEKGNVVIFKSKTPARIAENVDIFDFSLTPEDMAALDALTTEAAKAEALHHWEERRSGTPAPWGEGLRPERRSL